MLLWAVIPQKRRTEVNDIVLIDVKSNAVKGSFGVFSDGCNKSFVRSSCRDFICYEGQQKQEELRKMHNYQLGACLQSLVIIMEIAGE
mgnify:CR=1 FL=1